MTRQEAVRMIENDIRIHHDYLSGNYRKALRMAISALAQPERKKGTWIPHKEISREYVGVALKSISYDYWFCDACYYRVENGQPMYNFCPNCGADMRGGDTV